MKELSKNNSNINFLKGVGIIAVIYAHNDFSVWGKYIYTFHMPLFFFISGFLENPNKYEFKSYILKKTKRLLIPYFIYAFILYLFWFFIGRKFGDSVDANFSPLKNLIGIFYSQGGPEFMDWGIPMWFLPALFLTTILSYFILKLKPIYQVAMISGLAFISWYYSSVSNFMLPWSISIVFSATVFFYVGHWVRKLIIIINLTKKRLLIIIPILFLIHYYGFTQNTPVNMYYAQYGNYLLFIFNGVTGSIFLLSFSLLITNPLPSFIWLGKNSLIIMILHLRALTVVKAISLYIFSYTLEFTPIKSLEYTILQVLVLIIPILIINKYFGWTLGISSKNT